MRRRIHCNNCMPVAVIALCLLSGSFCFAGMPLRQTTGRIVSKHVLIRIPQEREWLGQETITDLETCYLFMDKTTGGNLPARVLVNISWDEPVTGVSPNEATITIGMNNAAAAGNSRRHLLHQAAKAMARLGLLELSKGGAERAESRFLLEGMTEILACEYEHSSRSLGAAWVRCHFMDRMEALSISALASWDRFSGGKEDQRAASPGITFLLTCREVSNRDRLLKFFEGLRSKNLPDSLGAAFKLNAATLESTWLEKIRTYNVAEDTAVGTDEDAPKLERTEMEPEAGVAGQGLQIRVTIRDRSSDLSPNSIFLEDGESGLILSAQPQPDAARRDVCFRLLVPQDRKAGRHGYRLIAVDDSGNVRTWSGAYLVGSK
jgi:hypothetical protein